MMPGDEVKERLQVEVDLGHEICLTRGERHSSEGGRLTAKYLKYSARSIRKVKQ